MREEEDYRSMVRNLVLFDDVFFRVCLKDNIPLAERILKVILDEENLKVTDLETQYDVKNLKGRSLLMDCHGCVNARPFNLEMERSKERASFQRVRYHSSLLDAEALKQGQDFTDLPDTYVIFITEQDVIGNGEPVTRIERVNLKTGQNVHDGSHILYVNGAYRGSDAFGKLMHDFGCHDPAKMYYDEIRRSEQYFKETEEGEKYMEDIHDLLSDQTIENIKKDLRAQAMAEGRAAGMAEGRAEGRTEGKAEGKVEGAAEHLKATVLRMLAKKKYTDEEIADLNGVSVETVHRIRTENPA